MTHVAVCGLHVLHHTCASLLVAAGAPVKAIRVQLGHASAEMTLNRYSHLFPDDLDALAVHFDAVRSTSDIGRRLTLFDHRQRASRRP